MKPNYKNCAAGGTRWSTKQWGKVNMGRVENNEKHLNRERKVCLISLRLSVQHSDRTVRLEGSSRRSQVVRT